MDWRRLKSEELLGDMEAEARLALIDLVVVVFVSEVCGAELWSSVEVSETLESVVGLERRLGEDQKVRLARAGVSTVHPPGISDGFGHAIS